MRLGPVPREFRECGDEAVGVFLQAEPRERDEQVLVGEAEQLAGSCPVAAGRRSSSIAFGITTIRPGGKSRLLAR